MRQRPERKNKWQIVTRQHGTSHTGDFKAHSIWWDPSCHVQSNAALWEHVIDKNGLEIWNDGRATHEWTWEGHKGHLIINLTLATHSMLTLSTIANDHTTGSNHEVITREVKVDRQQEADHERVVAWIIAAMIEEDMESREKLWIKQVKERAHLHAEWTAGEVEQEAAWCKEAMGSILDTMAKRIRICAQSNRWWNVDMKKSRNLVVRVTQRRRNSEEATRAQAGLQKSIRQTKRQMWSKYLANLMGAELWKVAWYTTHLAGAPVAALTDTEGNQANRSFEK